MPPRKRSDSKLKALLAQGTVNPHPEDVRDPAFLDSEFFDPRDLIQVKYEMLRRVRSEGHAVADAASSFGVSRPTFYKAQTDFERDGLAGLLPGKRGPRGPHKLTSKVMGFITRTVEKEPSLDAAALAKLIEQKLSVRVHRRTIERALARSKKKRP
jgi:transposase